MSRVDDARRRAGENPDHGIPVNADETHFAGSEPLDPPVVEAVENVRLGAGGGSGRPPGDELPPRDGGAPIVPRGQALPATLVPVPPAEEVRISDVLRMLRRRAWMIAAIVAAAAAAAVIYNGRATRIYEARARLIIEAAASQVVPFRPAIEENQASADYYQTQIEVLRSRALAMRALQDLGELSEDPVRQSAQINSVSRGLRVAPVNQSRVVSLAFRSSDPEYAATITNAVAKAYIDQNREARSQGSRDAATWLAARLEELQNEVNSSQQALQEYRERQDAVSLEDQQNIVVQKLAQLNTAVTAARAERIARQTLYEQLRALEASGAPLDTFPPIQSNGVIQSLKGELAALQREHAQLSERLGDLHPDMIKVKTAIETTERRLDAEIRTAVEGIRNNYRAAEAEERGLMAALEGQKDEVLALNQKSIGYGALQRNAASIQQVFESVLQRLKETELSGELQANNARILDLAEVPRVPILPQTTLNLVIAILGGLIGAVGLAFGLEYMNPRLVRRDDLDHALGLPVLGVTPSVAGLRAGAEGLANLPSSFQEALREVRTRVLLAAGTTTFAVTSTISGEGKTVVATNLAISLARAGRRVLLMDGDMRRSRLHEVFDVSRAPGLADVIGGQVKPSDVLRTTSVKGLFLLPAGSSVDSPADLLDSEQLQRLLQGFSQVFDVVIVDCPPVLPVADASIIAHAAAAALFVVGSGATSRDAARLALERLASVDAHVFGLVLNKAPREGGEGRYSRYYVEDSRPGAYVRS